MFCVTRSSLKFPPSESLSAMGTRLPLHHSRKAIYYWAWAPPKAKTPLQTPPCSSTGHGMAGWAKQHQKKNTCNRQYDCRQRVNSASRGCLLQHLHTLRRSGFNRNLPSLPPNPAQSDHQAILKCQNITQTWTMSLNYLKLLNSVSFIASYQTCSFFQRLHAIPPLCTPRDALCCRKDHSSHQKSKNHLMVCQKALLPCSRQTCPLKYFGQKP